MTSRHRFFYGWVLLSISSLTIFLAYTVWYSFPVFFVAMFQEFGWSPPPPALAGR